MARVEFDNVSKAYRDRKLDVIALDRLCLDIADGEILVIVGPSGCGKTTTLRLVAGLEDLSSGSISLGGRVVNGIPPKDRDVAMVFQNYALYPHMTVHDNMAFGLKMRGTSKADIQTKIAEAARRLSIEPLLHRKPGTLSGGEQQRVAIARAIVRRPNVFLFDEPLSNLDTSLRLQMRSHIRTLQRELGITTIHVTHDQEEAMTLGDRIAVMRSGRLQQCAAPLEVYGRPANLFVAGFIGSPPMNFLEGRLRSDGVNLCLECRLGRLPLPPAKRVEVSGRIPISPNGEVVLGLRPEHIRIMNGQSDTIERSTPLELGGMAQCSAARPSNQSYIADFETPATVKAIEPLGDRLHVRLVLPSGEEVIAKAPPEMRISLTDTVTLRFDLVRAHLFATDGG